MIRILCTAIHDADSKPSGCNTVLVASIVEHVLRATCKINLMSQIIFYLHARSGQSQALLTAAMELTADNLLKNDGIHMAVMRPRSEDILAAPANSNFLAKLDLVVEMVFPPGQPIKALQSKLYEATSLMLDLADRKQSFLVFGYQRTFQESGQKVLRYHYLMFRRPDYSRADYLDYYVHSHYRFGIATPLADYYQNYLDTEGGRELAALLCLNPFDADNISELRFGCLEDYLFSDAIHEIAPQAAADEELFVDRNRCQSFSMDVLLDSRSYH